MEKQLLGMIGSLQKDMGRVLAGIDNLKGYVGAVSENTKKIDEKLDEHVLSNTAHNLGEQKEAARERKTDWFSVVALLISAVALLIKIK